MKGQDQLIAMRKHGMNPPIVFIDLERDALKCWRDWHAIEGCRPCLLIEPEESIARLDLRCVHGLIVSVHGNDEARVAECARACSEAGASRVFGSVCGARDKRGAPLVTVMTDSEGETWRKS